MIENKITEDLKTAMKEKDKTTMNTLRAVKASYKLEQINKKQSPSDELLLSIIGREIKMRKESIKEFVNCNRPDLASSYQTEVDILTKYMPEELDDESLNKIIDEAFAKLHPTSIKDLGSIMKEIMPLVKNKCDMSKLNTIIRSKLN